MQQRDIEQRGSSGTEKPCYLWLSQKPISKLTDRQIIEIQIVLKKLTTLEISAALTKVEKSLENSKHIKPYQVKLIFNYVFLNKIILIFKQIPIIALEVFRHRETNDMLNDITNRRRSTILFSSLRNYSFRKNNKVRKSFSIFVMLF